MATAIFTPYKGNEGGVRYPRDASFSSYLDTAERDFVRSLAESINSSPSPAREISTPRGTVMGRNISRVKKSGESDVFGAERYFNNKNVFDDDKKGGMSPVVFPKKDGGGGGGEINKQRHHRREKRDDLLQKAKSSRSSNNIISSTSSLKSPTPSLKSQGSFNSQIGLLIPKKLFSGFQCKGSCFDKKSVYTTNTTQSSHPKLYQGNENNNGYRKTRLSHNQEHFAFPIIDTAAFNLDPPHKSMEVFGIHPLGKPEIEHNLERKLSILSWDAIPNSPTTPFTISLAKKATSPSVRTTEDDDDEDVRSDASSDLFEIAGFPGSQASTPYYAPSERSIEWSVVTASAVDNFSTFSDHDEDHKNTIPRERCNKNITFERKKVQRNLNSGGMFLGCTSHKAVDVLRNYHQP